jgi:hypothetical protein
MAQSKEVMPDFIPDEQLSTYEAAPDFIPDEPAAPTEEKTLTGFGANILSSGAKMAGDIVQAVPAIAQTAWSALTKPAQFATEAVPQMAEQAATDIPAYLGKRYGGGQQILDTLYNDPVGFMADLSTVLGGAGGAAKLGGMAKLASGLKKAEAIADPIAQVGRAVRAPLAAGGRAIGAPKRLYESALKPSGDFASAQEVVQTGLRESIPVSLAGADKADRLIKDITGQIDAKVAAINAPPTDPLDMALNAQTKMQAKFEHSVNKVGDYRDIDTALDEFLQGHTQPKTAGDLLKFKRASQKDPRIKSSYGRDAQDYAKIETKKQLVREAKEQLVRLDPDLSALNARDSALIDLEDEMLSAMKRIENRDIMNLGTGGAGIAGYAIGGPAGAAKLIAFKYLLNQPLVKSKLAIALNKAQKLKSSSLTKLSTLERVGETE